MIFLTPSGVKAKTAENYDQKVIPFSWRKIALLFRKALRVKALHQENNFSMRLVELYLRHVSNF
jgi:hypothetical protein